MWSNTQAKWLTLCILLTCWVKRLDRGNCADKYILVDLNRLTLGHWQYYIMDRLSYYLNDTLKMDLRLAEIGFMYRRDSEKLAIPEK